MIKYLCILVLEKIDSRVNFIYLKLLCNSDGNFFVFGYLTLEILHYHKNNCEKNGKPTPSRQRILLGCSILNECRRKNCEKWNAGGKNYDEEREKRHRKHP